jgi:ankyrin repeat protein
MTSIQQAKWVLFVVVAAISSAATADSGDDFSNNLFSDLAPILALFGEQVAMQFMSQSMGWADNIIFAMAPLGIITAIVAAIRVGGPVWLKAIIGRARENQADAEVELMSSTSHDVCELWDGKTIVRMQASPEILELLYFPQLRHGPQCGLFTLEEAKKGKLLTLETSELTSLITHYDRSLTSAESAGSTFLEEMTTRLMAPAASGDRDEEAQKGDPGPITRETSPAGKKDAPNIFLNLRPQKSRGELHLFAAFAIFLQAGVLLFSGCATYYPSMRYKKGGLPVAHYAYPLTAAGTVFLVVGMLICSFIVEQRTIEEVWRIDTQVLEDEEGFIDSEESGLQLLWIQKAADVNADRFESYVLVAQGTRKTVLTSRLTPTTKHSPASTPTTLTSLLHRLPGGFSQFHPAASNLSQILVICGTAVSCTGFIVQFTGLRGMHWSATIAQLVATLLMVLVRAWVRRGLALRPAAQRTPHDHELDWLATRIGSHPCPLWSNPQADENDQFWSENCPWGVASAAGIGGYALDKQPPSKPHSMVKIRERLGDLSKWRVAASDPAVSVANAIEVVMNTLFSQSTSEGPDSFHWSINGRNHGGGVSNSLIHFAIERKNGRWNANAAEIEAVLSLWLYAVQEAEQTSTSAAKADVGDRLRHGDTAVRRRSIRLLGRKEDVYLRDLRWYCKDSISGHVSEAETMTSSGAKPDAGSAQSNDAASVQTNEAAATGIPIDGHRVLGFTNMPPNMHPTASGNSTFTFKIRELLDSQNLESYGPKMHWRESTETEPDHSAIQLPGSQEFDPMDTRPFLAVLTDAPLENCLAWDLFSAFMWAVAERMAEPMRGETSVRRTTEPGTTTGAWNSFGLENTTLAKLANEVHRTGLGSLEDSYLSIVPPLSARKKLPIASCIVEYAREVARQHEAVGHWEEARDVYIWLFRNCKTFGERDPALIRATAVLFEFTRSVCDAAELWANQYRDSPAVEMLGRLKSSLVQELGQADESINNYLRSLYLIQGRDEGVKQMFEHPGRVDTDSDTAATRFDGFADATPLHKMYEDYYYSQQITDRKQYLNAKDVAGLTPLHYAAIKGSQDFAKALLDVDADAGSTDIVGWLPLHYSAVLGRASIVEELLKKATPQAGPNSKDLSGWTPLHYSAQNGHESICWKLLQEGAELDAQGRDGMAALHCAVKNGHLDAVKLLIEAGANVNIQDNSRRTPLQWAAYCGHHDLIALLVGNGASRTVLEGNGRTPLHLAALSTNFSESFKKTLECLGTSDLDVNAKDRLGSTPLHLAAAAGNGCPQAVTLIDCGAAIENKDRGGRTALHRAALSGHEATVKLLLDRGANTEAKDNGGGTALHSAARSGHEATVKLLLDRGAIDSRAAATPSTTQS